MSAVPADFLYHLSSRYSAPVLEKARKLIDNGLIERDEQYSDIWWAWGSDPDRPYRIQLGRNPSFPDQISYITCTCSHGLFVGAGDCRCSHSAAALFMLEEEAASVNKKLSAVEKTETPKKAVKSAPRKRRTKLI